MLQATLSSKENSQKLKNTENWNRFSKEQVGKADLCKSVLKEKTDHSCIMHKIQFRSPFKSKLKIQRYETKLF